LEATMIPQGCRKEQMMQRWSERASETVNGRRRRRRRVASASADRRF
jgi:hypothetical protein